MNTILSKKYLMTMSFGLILLSIIIYFMCTHLFSTLDFNNIINHSVFQIMMVFFIFIALYTTTAQYSFEINREKLDKRLEFMLSSPLSIIDVLYGKILSILVLCYLVIVFVVIILLTVLNFFNIPIFKLLTIETWGMILLILPFFMVLYSSFMIWISYKFAPNMNILFNFLFYILFFIILFSKNYLNQMKLLDFLTKGFVEGNVITQSILLVSILLLFICFILIYMLFKRLDKEKMLN